MLRVQRNGNRLSVTAPAKINLGLHLLAKRDDGFHDIESLLMAVDLSDGLSATAASSLTLSVQAEGADAPSDESNLVLRAARLLQQAEGVEQGAAITLSKRIPSGRGLGGGSSDAAATLRLLSALWRLDLPEERLVDLASQLGSDVPFFLGSPLAVVSGRGDIVTPVPGDVSVAVLLLVPPWGLSTREVYGASRPPLTRSDEGGSLALVSHLRTGRLSALQQHLVNDLEPAASALCSKQKQLRETLVRAGATCVSMTGSGSAVYALTASPEDAHSMAGRLHLDTGVSAHVLAPWHHSESSLGWDWEWDKEYRHGGDRSEGETRRDES
jgi:4-diphosphocytidyl-2-C-methyl-D-erythritol kinase